jgi:hypothetical protein
MKPISFKFLYALTLLSGILISEIASAQRSENPAERSAKNVFVELGGQGLLITANYDTRFTKKRNGIGGRVGIGYLSADDDHITTFPLSLNYLLGKEKHFFEVGLGATIFATTDENSLFLDETNSNVIGTMSFSYRVQPVDSGVSFRAGLTPVFNSDFFLPYFAGISLGYTFR